MAENKTQPTNGDVAAFLDAVEPPQRREDGKTICGLMARITGEPPVLWGPSIVGFGRYRYRYESGREGVFLRIGFSPRKAQLALYIIGGLPSHEALLARLGKHRTGKSCLYVRTLADVDMAVLEELVAAGWAHMAQAYPD